MNAHRFESIAFPLIGAGTGGLTPIRALSIMQETLLSREIGPRVVLVKFDG
jgi:O-acetyl-ADP-ribose deacetylase (regulator of RNase III)